MSTAVPDALRQDNRTGGRCARRCSTAQLSHEAHEKALTPLNQQLERRVGGVPQGSLLLPDVQEKGAVGLRAEELPRPATCLGGEGGSPCAPRGRALPGRDEGARGRGAWERQRSTLLNSLPVAELERTSCAALPQLRQHAEQLEHLQPEGGGKRVSQRSLGGDHQAFARVGARTPGGPDHGPKGLPCAAPLAAGTRGTSSSAAQPDKHMVMASH